MCLRTAELTLVFGSETQAFWGIETMLDKDFRSYQKMVQSIPSSTPIILLDFAFSITNTIQMVRRFRSRSKASMSVTQNPTEENVPGVFSDSYVGKQNQVVQREWSFLPRRITACPCREPECNGGLDVSAKPSFQHVGRERAEILLHCS